MTSRIERLKEALNARTVFSNWFLLEKIKMNSYLETKGQPTVLRRAKMFERLLDEMPLSIGPDDQLAGTLDDCFATSYNLFKNELENFEGYCGYEGLYREVRGIFPEEEIDKVKEFWESDLYEKQMSSLFSPTEQLAMAEGVYFVEPVTGHVIFDAPTVLTQGFNGISARVSTMQSANTDPQKAEFYDAMQIALQAASRFSLRYAKLAESMAAQEKNPQRSQELLKLAAACKRVPAQPAESFYEALVSFFLAYMMMHVEQTPNPYAFSIGRIDQFFWPMYEKSLTKGEITPDAALELIEELWMKFDVGNKVWAVSQNAVVGGVTREGKDATNELTFLCIQATDELMIPLPTLTVKLHSGSPERLLHTAAALSSKGRGNPTIVNDDVVVRSKTEMGVSIEDARDSVIAGCQEFLVQGAENARTTSLWFSLPKCLELMLNGGKSTLTGKQVAPNPGDLDALADFEAFYSLYWKQVEYFADIAVKGASGCDKTLADNRPVPFISAIMKDCVEKGRDFRMDGARYNFSGFLCHGVANLGDAMHVIKKYCFDEKIISFAELGKALVANWKGYEALRERILGEDKYGNDKTEVDAMTVRIADRVFDFVPKYKNHSGATFRPGFSTPSTHVLYGRKCGATPDGRCHRDSFAYGFGPMQGVNKNGPTAVINSCTKFEQYKALHGLAFNLSFPPSAVQGPEGIQRLESIIAVYLKKGGRYIQFNIQDVDTLRKAQKEPDKYRDLVVRVHGMSAYFCNLDPLIQEDIIVRVQSGL